MEETDFIVKEIHGKSINKNVETWIYETESLARCLTDDDYLTLISIDFRSKYAAVDVEQLLTNYVDWPAYHKWALRVRLESVLEHSENAVRDLELLYDDYCSGYGFLRDIGLAFGLNMACPLSELGINDWVGLGISERDSLLQSMYPDVATAAKTVLDWLDDGKVILVSDEHDDKTYIDNRTDEEKQLRFIKVARAN